MREGLLPGGIPDGGKLRRSFGFSALTGEVELALWESSDSDNMPEAVTRCLTAVLEEIGGQPANMKRVSELSVGDRQHLMRRLQILLDGDQGWYSTTCAACHAEFDFQVQLSQLPIKEAGKGYPFADVTTSMGECRFRVPNGRDQSALSGLADEEQACAALLRRCLVSVNGESPNKAIIFSIADHDAIEAALEVVAPEIGCEISVSCIECQTENIVNLDPYACIGKSSRQIVQDIHKIAWHYHWGEDEILRMPRNRRQWYLDMIDAARGLGGGVAGGG